MTLFGVGIGQGTHIHFLIDNCNNNTITVMLPVRKPLRLPRTIQDRTALSAFTFGGGFLLWYECCHVLPTYYPEWSLVVYIHFVMATWLAFSIYGNMYMLITTDVTGQGFLPKTDEPGEDWKPNCIICQRQGPPRSHHCKLCNVCVLKRDHHCWFAGSCVGYHNHRYYVAMVIYICIAAIYCNIFNIYFVSNVIGGFEILKIFSIIFPHVGWILGYTDTYIFFIKMLTTIGILLNLLFLWLLKIQVTQIKYCQTQYERKTGIVRYDIGWKNYVIEVLGEKWYLVLLSPWIQSPLPGDGIHFPVMEFKDKQF